MSLNDEVAEAVKELRGMWEPHHPALVKVMLEAVTEPCPGRWYRAMGIVGNEPGPTTFQPCLAPRPCPNCRGLGRVPRNWEEIGEGTLAGRLYFIRGRGPRNDSDALRRAITSIRRWCEVNSAN